MKKIEINTYAVLKDYLPSKFTLETNADTIEELIRELVEQHPKIQNILESCRFAVDLKFVHSTFKIHQNTEIHMIPPSSGG